MKERKLKKNYVTLFENLINNVTMFINRVKKEIKKMQERYYRLVLGLEKKTPQCIMLEKCNRLKVKTVKKT